MSPLPVWDSEAEALETIAHFTVAAKAYCSLIENLPDVDQQESAHQLSVALSELYAAAHHLKSPINISDDDRTARLSDERRTELSGPLWDKLEPFDFFQFFFSPFEDKEPTGTGLTILLIDVYEDVKEGLLLIEMQADPEHVQWEWWWGFENHWGKHAIDAMKALQSVMWPW